MQWAAGYARITYSSILWRQFENLKIKIFSHGFDFNLGVAILRVKTGFNISDSLRSLLSDDSNVIKSISDGKVEQKLILDSPTTIRNTLEPSPAMPTTTHSAPDLRNTTEFSLQILKNAKKPSLQKRLKQKLNKKARFSDQSSPITDKCRSLALTMNQFRTRHKEPVIDVYWLFDDGGNILLIAWKNCDANVRTFLQTNFFLILGLTMLVPYLLTVPKSYLEGAKLRVFCVASSKKAIDQEQLWWGECKLAVYIGVRFFDQ